MNGVDQIVISRTMSDKFREARPLSSAGFGFFGGLSPTMPKSQAMLTPAREFPELPSELWMLWMDSDPDDASHPGTWVRAIDGKPHDLYLVCTSEADAVAAADYQNRMYLDRDCRPVRVK